MQFFIIFLLYKVYTKINLNILRNKILSYKTEFESCFLQDIDKDTPKKLNFLLDFFDLLIKTSETDSTQIIDQLNVCELGLKTKTPTVAKIILKNKNNPYIGVASLCNDEYLRYNTNFYNGDKVRHYDCTDIFQKIGCQKSEKIFEKFSIGYVLVENLI